MIDSENILEELNCSNVSKKEKEILSDNIKVLKDNPQDKFLSREFSKLKTGSDEGNKDKDSTSYPNNLVRLKMMKKMNISCKATQNNRRNKRNMTNFDFLASLTKETLIYKAKIISITEFLTLNEIIKYLSEDNNFYHDICDLIYNDYILKDKEVNNQKNNFTNEFIFKQAFLKDIDKNKIKVYKFLVLLKKKKKN